MTESEERTEEEQERFEEEVSSRHEHFFHFFAPTVQAKMQCCEECATAMIITLANLLVNAAWNDEKSHEENVKYLKVSLHDHIDAVCEQRTMTEAEREAAEATVN